MEIVTIERKDLEDLIDRAVTRAVERALSPPDQIMTAKEVAKYLRRSRTTVHRLVRQGMPQRNGRFVRSEIDRWLATGANNGSLQAIQRKEIDLAGPGLEPRDVVYPA